MADTHRIAGATANLQTVVVLEAFDFNRGIRGHDRLDNVLDVAADLARRIDELDAERARLEEEVLDRKRELEEVDRQRNGLTAARDALSAYELPTTNQAGR